MTGKDVPMNFRLFFGVGEIPKMHQEIRYQVLIMTAVVKGSMRRWRMHVPDDFDRSCPRLTPRRPWMREFHELQERLEDL